MNDAKSDQGGMLSQEEPTGLSPGHHPAPSVGAQLAAHRQAKGWTIDQVSNSLKLAPRQVEAIESDNHAMLPGIAVTRGFVRSYAKLLRIDAAPLLALMASATEPLMPGSRSMSAPFSGTRQASFGVKRSNGKLAIVLLLIAAVVAAIFGLQRFDSLLPFTGQSEQKQAVGDADGASSTVTSTTSSPVSEMPVPATAAEPNAEQAVAASSATPVPNNALDQTTQAVDASPKSGNVLKITVKQDSWLEIRRVAGNDVLIARLIKAGSVETVEVDSPVKLTVGNAAGVEAILRGEPIKLQTAAGGNVARMTIK